MMQVNVHEFAKFVSKLDADEIGRFASGGFGVEKRVWFTEMMKRVALELVKK